MSLRYRISLVPYWFRIRKANGSPQVKTEEILLAPVWNSGIYVGTLPRLLAAKTLCSKQQLRYFVPCSSYLLYIFEYALFHTAATCCIRIRFVPHSRSKITVFEYTLFHTAATCCIRICFVPNSRIKLPVFEYALFHTVQQLIAVFEYALFHTADLNLLYFNTLCSIQQLLAVFEYALCYTAELTL